MAYRVVEEYYRQEHFDFFRSYRNPFYSLTFTLDMTALKAFVEERGYSTYLNLCYFFAKGMQEVEDFRYRLLDGEIVLYDQLHVGLTLPAENGRFRFGYFRFHSDVDVFNSQSEQKRPGVGGGESLLQEEEQKDYIYFTALPKVPFTSFSHASDEPMEGAPRVAFGQFSRQQGRLKVPVGLQVNHAFIDGAAVGELVEQAQRHFHEPG